MDALAFEAAEQSFLVAVAGVETLADLDPREVIEGPAPARARGGQVSVAMLRHGHEVVPLYDLAAVLANPTGGNAVYESVLSGASDSEGNDQQLLLAGNDRTFVS